MLTAEETPVEVSVDVDDTPEYLRGAVLSEINSILS